jgi:DNA topoisomerase VI subunit A
MSTNAAKIVLLIEKEATFQKLAQDPFFRTNAILVSGKGMPDLSTRFINQYFKRESRFKKALFLYLKNTSM